MVCCKQFKRVINAIPKKFYKSIATKHLLTCQMDHVNSHHFSLMVTTSKLPNKRICLFVYRQGFLRCRYKLYSLHQLGIAGYDMLAVIAYRAHSVVCLSK